jgi:nicotinate-nucleotide pyrophosphorylase (carboxylating)
MEPVLFEAFFGSKGMAYLDEAIDLALREDGLDLTSWGLFGPEEQIRARILAKEELVMAGLPIASRVLERCSGGGASLNPAAAEGETVPPRLPVAFIQGPARSVLKAERVMLNFLCHLSGIATLTRKYAERLHGTRTRLLDTRKTLPGLRYPEKYAVRLGGGLNHRIDLEEMLMLKDNHIDRWGGIDGAVRRLRSVYADCPPIEVECRTLEQVREAVTCSVNRIMLDNMNVEELRSALALIPASIQSEVSGSVTLDTIGTIAAIGPDFISVGRLTHSAPSVDLSLQYEG